MSTDTLTGIDTTLEADHAYVHQKLKFTLNGSTSSLAAGTGQYAIHLKAPTTAAKKALHYRPMIINPVANTFSIKIYEGLAATASATKRLGINRWRPVNPVDGSNYDLPSHYFNIGGTVPSAATLAAGRAMISATAGGNFANQPAGDGVEIVSSSTVDTDVYITIHGTKTGATATVTSETVKLNGTTAVATVETTWQNILGIELSKRCSGTITIREASADATIITMTSGTLSVGVITPTVHNKGYGAQLLAVASGAATTPVGFIGKGTDGTGRATTVSAVIALNGTTGVTTTGEPFGQVDKILVGAVASSVNVTASSQYIPIYQGMSGLGGPAGGRGSTGGATEEIVIEPGIDYTAIITNVGATTASVGDFDFTVYEENVVP